MTRAFSGILVSFCVLLYSPAAFSETLPAKVCHQDQCVTVEVVSKAADLERGLMYRKKLEENTGMLFVFPADDVPRFWMKNMLFNLDILWISDDKHIVYVSNDLPACAKDPCPVYIPNQKARYVLEVRGGYALSHHWQAGDQLVFKNMPVRREGG